MSVGSDDISRETLRIARHGLAARISRVVPFSLRGFPKKTLSKFAGREVTGSLAHLAVVDHGGRRGRAAIVRHLRMLTNRVPACRTYARRSFSVRIGGVRAGQRSLRTRPSCDSGPVMGSRKACGRKGCRSRRCRRANTAGSPGRSRPSSSSAKTVVAVHVASVVVVVVVAAVGGVFSSTALDRVDVDFSGDRSVRRRHNRR